MTFGDWTIHDPWWLAAWLVIPLVAWLRTRRGSPVLVVPFASAWFRQGFATGSRWPAVAAALGIALMVFALARPQKIEDRREDRKEGYDLMLAIDLSGSMLAEDYERSGTRINRLQAIKPVIDAFIEKRPNDRIGLIVFAGRAYTLAPLTFDHAWIRRQAARLEVGLDEDGTAIGDGLGVALSRLEQTARAEDGKRLGAFIVLLTDGANNKGAMAPHEDAAIAAARGIPVFTIGAGRPGYVPMPIPDERGRPTGRYRRVISDLDEATLQAISKETGGEFFRAMDTNTIESAFASIDRARKIEFEAKSQLLTRELFHWFAGAGALFLAVGGIGARRPAWPFGKGEATRSARAATATEVTV
jgi:Ca-activated chloride channel family protein